MPATEQPLRFLLNGAAHTLRVAPDARLVDLLRDAFNLTACRAACDIGRCGACLVLRDNEPVNACLVMAWQVAERAITTAEGLADCPVAQTLRGALAEENAFQCGYCAPGFVIALTALLRANPHADEGAIRAALDGNLCRCTGYHSIIRGALRAVAVLSPPAQPDDHTSPSAATADNPRR